MDTKLLSVKTLSAEGFPMVIPEAMQFGCIPFVFDSFPAVRDMIDDGRNGFVIPVSRVGRYIKFFLKSGIARYCEALMTFAAKPESELLPLRKDAIEKSRVFDVENVWAQWNALLNK